MRNMTDEEFVTSVLTKFKDKEKLGKVKLKAEDLYLSLNPDRLQSDIEQSIVSREELGELKAKLLPYAEKLAGEKLYVGPGNDVDNWILDRLTTLAIRAGGFD